MIWTVLYRVDEIHPNVCAVIGAEESDSVKNHEDLLGQLTQACTEWMINTERGQDAWDYAGDDFNIGDLMSFADPDDIEFKQIAHRHGIYGLKFIQPEPAVSANFDTPLVDSSRVQDALGD